MNKTKSRPKATAPITPPSTQSRHKHSRLRIVIKFELMRNLKKPSFWLAAVAIPIFFIAYIFFAGLLGVNIEGTISADADLAGQKLGLFDESLITSPAFLDTQAAPADNSAESDAVAAEAPKFEQFETKEQGIDAVKSGDINVFYFIPADFVENPAIEIYTQTDRSNLFSSYDQPIRDLLATSAATRIATADIIAITGSFTTTTTTYTPEGAEDNLMSRIIVPVIALALFFILVVMFGNRLTMSTVEEKENRITEMLLTSLSTTTLIMGKIISLIVLGLIQLAILIIPIIILYLYGNTQGILPEGITIDWSPWIVISSALLLVLSYFLFAGFSVAIGTIVPTAKELAPYASVLMILVIMPLFSITSFMSSQPDAFTYILSYFPLSAPMALMLRNAFGTLPAYELILGLLNLALFSFISIRLAVYLFKRSAMDFTSKLSLHAIVQRGPRTKW